MSLKLKVLLLLVLVQLVVSISYTPDDEKKPGCAPKEQGKSAKRSYIRYNRNPRYHSLRNRLSRNRNSRYNRSKHGRVRVSAALTEITCKNVVAFYDGTFSNYRPHDMKVRFEFHLRYENDRYHGKFEHWNEDVNNPSSKLMWCFGDSPKFNITGEVGSTGNYYSGNYIGTRYDRYTYDYNNGNLFRFLSLESRVGEGLVLTRTVGQCTKVDHYNEGAYPALKQDLYKSCVCCGDTYNPHPSLDCPTNPWASKQPKPDC